MEIFEAAIARRAGRPRFATLSAAPRPEPPAAPSYDATGVTPAAARHEALSLAVDLRGGRPATDWLVVPPHGSGSPVVVLPMAARQRFLRGARRGRRRRRTSRCATRPPTAGTSAAAPVAELAVDLLRGRTSAVALEPWPHGRRDGTPPC